jgi:Tfp pilus assembly protein PilF
VANSYGYFLAEKDSDLDLAEGLIKEALDAEPENGAFLDSMGWVMYRQGKLESALDYMIQAVNVLPDDPIILEHLGIVFRDLGQTSQARETLARALAVGGEPERLEPLIRSLDEETG